MDRLALDIIFVSFVIVLRSGITKGNFVEMLDACIRGNNNKILSGMTAETCKTACLEESDFCCRSVDYMSSAAKCHLSVQWSGSVALSDPCYLSGYDYYERIDPACAATTSVDETTLGPTTKTATIEWKQSTQPYSSALPAATTETIDSTLGRQTTETTHKLQDTTVQDPTLPDTTVQYTTLQDITVHHTTLLDTTEQGTTLQDTTVQDTLVHSSVKTTVDAQDTTATTLNTTLNVQETTETTLNVQDTTETTLHEQDTTETMLNVQDTTETTLDVRDTTKTTLNVRDTTDTTLNVPDTTETTLNEQDTTETTLNAQDASATAQISRNASTTAVNPTEEVQNPAQTASTAQDTSTTLPKVGDAPKALTLRQRVPVVKESKARAAPTEAKGAEYIGSTELILLGICGLFILASDLNTYKTHIEELNGIVYLLRKK